MSIRKNLLELIRAKTNGRCWYCGDRFHSGEWQVEHQQPRSKDGTDNIDNLVPSCRPCNVRKGNRTLEEYRDVLVARLENKISEAYDCSMAIGECIGRPDGLLALSSVTDLLLNAAETAVSTAFLFYGELSESIRKDVSGNESEHAS